MGGTYLSSLATRKWQLPRAGFPVGDVADSMSIRELRGRLASLIDGDVVLPALFIKPTALMNNQGVKRALTKRRPC